MTQITLHGWGFSPFLRAVRIALNEKSIAHQVREMTPADLATPSFRALSPFGKVPVLEHDGARLIETAAILRHVDAAFPAPALQPEEPLARARMDGLAQAAGAYLYPTAVMGVFFTEAYVTANGGTPDQAALARAVDQARPVLAGFEREVAGPFAVGPAFSLADCLLGPMLENLAMAPAGAALLADLPRLSGLLAAVSARPSVRATRAPIPLFGLG